METQVVESKFEEQDLQMDEIAKFWEVRHDEFNSELIERKETSCCGGARSSMQSVRQLSS